MRSIRPCATAVLISLLCWSGNALADDPDTSAEEQRRAAQSAFEAASRLFDAGRYEEAIKAYQASYTVVPSPNSRLMIARSLRELGRSAEAYREYEEVAAEAEEKGDRYDKTREAAAQELDELRAQIARLELSVADAPAGTEVRVGDASLSPDALGAPLVLDPGAVQVLARAPDGREAREELTLEAGEERQLTLTLPAPEEPEPEPAPAADVTLEPPSSLRTWAYVAGGVGAAGFAAFGVLGVMNNSRHSDLQAACPGNLCPPDREDDIASGRRLQTFANIGLAVGIVGLGTGITLFLLDPPGSGEQAATAPRTRLVAGPGSVQLQGQF